METASGRGLNAFPLFLPEEGPGADFPLTTVRLGSFFISSTRFLASIKGVHWSYRHFLRISLKNWQAQEPFEFPGYKGRFPFMKKLFKVAP
jgi:hypothetical protein